MTLFSPPAALRAGNGVPLVMMGAKVTYDNIMAATEAEARSARA